MSVGLVLLFDLAAGDPTGGALLAATIVDESGVSTTFTEAASDKARTSWEQNVTGNWEHTTLRTPSDFGRLLGYNMLAPVAYEEYATRDEAKTRSDELISNSPDLRAGTYSNPAPAPDEDDE